MDRSTPPEPLRASATLHGGLRGAFRHSFARKTHHRGKQGTLTWTLETDRFVIGY